LTRAPLPAKGAPSQLTPHSGEAAVAFREWRNGAVPDQKRGKVALPRKLKDDPRHVEAQVIEV
jgi:hypothetical protein